MDLHFPCCFAIVRIVRLDSLAIFGSEPVATEAAGPAIVSRMGSLPPARLAAV